jgi:serine/threonine-protein kinase
MPVDVGQLVANKYELVRLLGRGSMGEVWSAHHKALNEQVALKLLSWPPSGDDAEEPAVALARFRFEAQVAARLSRKTRHIARVTDYGEDDGLPYLVMELLDGEALDAALRTRGPFGLAEAVEIVSQIARALVQAHQEGVAHRDLTPANVFLSRDEEGRVLVKLLDFGIARPIQARRARGAFSTARGFVFGTPGYMSPEQSRATSVLDHRCDVWALATIAYEMLTGHLPVDGHDADELMKNLSAGRIVPLRQRDARLPAALDAFFERAFADHVDDRFAGAASLAQAFDLACGGGISGTFQSSVPGLPDSSGSTAIDFSANVAPDAPQVPRRRLGAVAVASACAIAAVVALGGTRATWRGAPRASTDSTTAPTAVPSAELAARPATPSSAPPAAPSLTTAERTVVASGPPVAEKVADKVVVAAPSRLAAGERVPPRSLPSRQPAAADVASSQPPRAVPKPVENRDDVF